MGHLLTLTLTLSHQGRGKKMTSVALFTRSSVAVRLLVNQQQLRCHRLVGVRQQQLDEVHAGREPVGGKGLAIAARAARTVEQPRLEPARGVVEQQPHPTLARNRVADGAVPAGNRRGRERPAARPGGRDAH